LTERLSVKKEMIEPPHRATENITVGLHRFNPRLFVDIQSSEDALAISGSAISGTPIGLNRKRDFFGIQVLPRDCDETILSRGRAGGYDNSYYKCRRMVLLCIRSASIKNKLATRTELTKDATNRERYPHTQRNADSIFRL
jgi:hypothetical protein